MVLLAVTCYIGELQGKNQVEAVSLGSALLLNLHFFASHCPILYSYHSLARLGIIYVYVKTSRQPKLMSR